MGWQCTIQYDGDVSDVGLFTLTWTDPIPSFGIFTFSQRMQVQYARVMAFIHAAVVARDAWQVKKQEESDEQDWILETINAYDPKGTK